MRKLFLTAVIALLSIGAFAQEGRAYLGGQLAYPTDIESLGVGLKGGYGITDAIRAQATFDYFLKKNNASWISIWMYIISSHLGTISRSTPWQDLPTYAVLLMASLKQSARQLVVSQ